MKDIDEVINKSLEQKRALAVKMVKQGYPYKQISDLLNVSSSFVEKWRALYNKQGASCFPSDYKGSDGYLKEDQKQAIYKFITTKSSCRIEELISFIEEKYGVVFQSKQSYYDLLYDAGMSWRKTEKENPKKDEEKVALKQEEIKKTSIPKGRNSFREFGRVNGRRMSFIMG